MTTAEMKLIEVLDGLTKVMAELKDLKVTRGGGAPEGGGKGGGSGGGGFRRDRNVLGGKDFEGMKKFEGGEQAWRDWSYDYKMLIETRTPELVKAMKFAENEKDEMKADDLEEKLKETVRREGGTDEEKYDDLETMARELFRWLVLKTDGEAKMLVKSVESGDGLVAWKRIHKNA